MLEVLLLLLTYPLRSFDVTAAIRSTRKVNVSCYYRACYTDRITCLFVRVCYKQAIYKVLSTLYTIKLPYATPRRRSVACVCSCLNLTCFPMIFYRYIDIIKNIFERNTLRFEPRGSQEFDNLKQNFRQHENFNRFHTTTSCSFFTTWKLENPRLDEFRNPKRTKRRDVNFFLGLQATL